MIDERSPRMSMPSLDDDARQFAEATARVIATAIEIGLPDVPEKLVTIYAIRVLAHAYVDLRDQVRALHDRVDQTDPNDPIGTALTQVGLAQRPPEGKPRGPRLVPTLRSAAQLAELDLDQLLALYSSVMGDRINFTKHDHYIVRQWDGMDGCWTDCTGAVPLDEALIDWAQRTDGGTQRVSYAEINYFSIFPGGTHMLWDGSEGKELNR